MTRSPDGTYDCDVLGGKANLTDISAAIGLGQLRRLDAFNQRRGELARRYFSKLSGLKDLLDLPPADFEHSNWHMFQVLLPAALADQRGEVIRLMREAGIATGVHYPAIHLTSLYRKLGLSDFKLPHTESVAARILTLPLFPSMQDADIDRVVHALDGVLQQLTPEKTCA